MKAYTKIDHISSGPDSKTNSSFYANFMPLSDLNLANHFLIAMPKIHDPMFDGAVIYVCEHNERGALGVVINKPTDMNIESLLERINIKIDPTPEIFQTTKKLVMFGGPVQDDRGFVLHTPFIDYSSTIKIGNEVAFTTSRDVLEAVAGGRGPKRLLISIGYSSWGSGQLEEEIIKNGWLTVPADPAILFDLPIEQRYTASMKVLGFDPVMLSGETGHA